MLSTRLTANQILDVHSPTGDTERKEDASGGAPVNLSPTSAVEKNINTMAQSMRTDIQVRGDTTTTSANNNGLPVQTG